MATSTTELILKFTGDPSQLKQTLAQVRADLSSSGQAHVNVARQTNRQISTEQKSLTREYEKEERERRRAAESLQRQKSAALIAIWRAEQREKARIERDAERRAAGQKPFGELLQGLNQSLITIQGPLGGLASRIGSAQTQFQALSTGATAAGSAIAGIAVPVGAAIAALAALGATAAAGVEGLKGLFSLAKDAAEFQGKLFDLSQQTGVSVETLSALDVVARTTGSSIDQIVASLGIFQKNLEESLDPQSKAAEAFKRLEVEVTNTEETLRATLTALAKMPEGFRQTALALELFGRGGKSVLAILKETNGDIDGTINRLQGLGLVTNQQARAADEFNDQLVLLQVALRGLGTEAIPLITDALKSLNQTVKDNREGFKFLQSIVGFLAGSFSLQLKAAVGLADQAWRSHKSEVDIVIEAYQILRTVIRGTAAEIPKIAIPIEQATSGLQLLRELKQFGVPLREKQDFSKIPELFLPDPEKAAAEAANTQRRLTELAQRFADLRLANNITALEAEEAALKRSLDSRAISFEEFNQKLRVIESRRHLRTIASLIAERESLTLQEAAAERLSNSHQRQIELANIRNKQQEVDNRLQAERIRHGAVLNGLKDDEAKITEEITEFIKQQDESIAQLIQSSSTWQKNVKELIESLRKKGVELTKTQAHWIRFNALLGESIERMKKLNDLFRESELPTPPTAPGASPGGIPEETAPIEVLPGELPPPPDFNPWKDAIEQLRKQLADFSQFISSTVVGAINGIGQALGDGVVAWVLYGEGFGKAMRQSLALLAAKIAAEATMQAVLHAAYAIGSLAFGDVRGAAQHALAAAKFGALAAGAAIIGRGIAGNSFKGGSGGGVGTGAGGGPPQQINPLTLPRNHPQPQRIVVQNVIEVRTKDSEFGRAIDTHIVKNVTQAGPLREVFANDGAF